MATRTTMSSGRGTRWTHGLVITALACATAAMPAAAQEGRIEIASRGWLGFSYEPVFSLGPRGGLVIRAVSDDSPAERAGIQPGDTLLEVNGINATPQLVLSLGSSLAPGDTVRLRLRRDGRDRALTLEAAERSVRYMRRGDAAGIIAFSPDTLRRRLRILTDSLRVYADTFRMPNVYFHWQGDGGEGYRAYWRAPDSTRVSWESPRGGHVIGTRDVNGRIRVSADSTWREIAPGIRTMRLRTDSLFRYIETDTAWRRFAVEFDNRGRSHFAPFDAGAWPGVATLGMRAVAGAELTDLTPGLARAFNTRNGVLVLRVPEDTPARRAGLAEADVIVRVNGTGIESVGDLRRIISRAHTASEPARLEVLRNGRRVMVVLR